MENGLVSPVDAASHAAEIPANKVSRGSVPTISYSIKKNIGINEAR
jgi:hypothetical protein